MTARHNQPWDHVDDDDDVYDDVADNGDQDEDGDHEPTIPCPACGEEMYDDAPRCPHCGSYVVDEDHAMSGRPTWVILTALVCLAMALGWVFAW